jgi:integrase
MDTQPGRLALQLTEAQLNSFLGKLEVDWKEFVITGLPVDLKLQIVNHYLQTEGSDLQGLVRTRTAPTARPLSMGHLYAALERDYVINGDKSVRNVRSVWKHHLQAVFAEKPAATLDSEQLQRYVVARQAEGAANATINRELAAVKRMFSLARRDGKLRECPYIPHLEERNVRKGFVKDAEYEALARETAAIGLWLRTMFELGYTYGWRKSELLGMRVDQVDLSERTIRLDAGETKNDEARQVEMTAKVYELLNACCAGKSAEDLVFTRTPGNRPKQVSRIVDIRNAWHDATAAAGCPDLLFHDLRRTAIRNMRRHGISEKVAMTISGHKTRSVFERYNIVDRADMHEAVGKLERGARDRTQHNPEGPPKKSAGSVLENSRNACQVAGGAA